MPLPISQNSPAAPASRPSPPRRPLRPAEGAGAAIRRLRARNRELAHRLSAQLTLAAMLLAEQRAAAPDAATREALVRCERQLATLGSVNRLLDAAGDPAARVRVDAALTEVAERMHRASPRPFTLQLELAPATLPDAAANALALVVTELLTNSMKHALGPVGGGGGRDCGDESGAGGPRVVIRLRRLGAQLALDYADSGAGARGTADTPRAARDTGEGLGLVAALLDDLGAAWSTGPTALAGCAGGFGLRARWPAT